MNEQDHRSPAERAEACRCHAQEAALEAARSTHLRNDYLFIAESWAALAAHYARRAGAKDER